eukprot:273235_1
MAAKKRNHVDAIKRNQALHTFMFQTNSTSFMLKDGPSSTKTAKTGCAHSHSKHIWCNICRKAIAYHNMQNAEKHLKTHAALYHQFTSSYNHQFLQSPPVKRVKRSIAQNDEDLVKFGYSVLEGNQVDTRMRTRYRIPPSDPWRFDTSDSNTNRNTLSDNEYTFGDNDIDDTTPQIPFKISAIGMPALEADDSTSDNKDCVSSVEPQQLHVLHKHVLIISNDSDDDLPHKPSVEPQQLPVLPKEVLIISDDSDDGDDIKANVKCNSSNTVEFESFFSKYKFGSHSQSNETGKATKVDRTLWQKMEIEQEAIKSKKKTRKALKRKHCKTDKRKKKTIAHAKKKQTKMNDVMIVNALPEEDNGYDENVSPSIEEVRDEHSIKTPKHKSLSSRTRRQLLKLIVKFDPHHVELTDDILNDISRNPAFEMYTKYELYRNVFSFFKTVARTLFDGMVVQHNEEIEKKKKRKMKRRKHCKTDAKKKRNAKKKKKRTIEYNFDSEESNGICDSEESNGICDSEGEPNRKLRRSKRLQKNKQIAIQNEVQRESQIKFCIDECIQNEKSEDGDVTWIECEGNNCARKWFHIECLGIAENELSDIKNYFCNDCM